MAQNSVFEKLFQINVNEHVEKKNGLSYLSWPYAWAEVKKLYPEANYKVYEAEDGCIYFNDGRTAWVKTGVTVEGLEHIEYLPIMDYRNKSIPVENITSFDVNKTIQRSLTKALARHGLGLYLYAGEDLPEVEVEKISARDAQVVKAIVDKFENADKLYESLLNKYHIKSFKELTVKQYVEIVQGLNDLSESRSKKDGDEVHNSGKSEGKTETKAL